MAIKITPAVIIPAASAWYTVDTTSIEPGSPLVEKINTNDTLSTEYCTTATPVTNYMVTKEAYTTNYGSIGYYPCKDEVVDLSATLQPARLTPAPPPFPVH